MKLKRLERAWKAMCLRAACTLMRTLAPQPDPPDWSRPSRVLFLRQDRLGDAIVSSGLLRAIRTHAPAVRIDALASPRNAAVLRRDPSVHAVHVFDKRSAGGFVALSRRLRAARYDAVIDCMVTAPSMTGLLLMLVSGARHRIGIAGRGVDAALTIPVPPERESKHIIQLLGAIAPVFGADPRSTDFKPAIALTADELAAAEARWPTMGESPGPRLLVNVSAGRGNRRWPDQRFVQTIAIVRESFPSLAVLVIGAPSEWESVEAVARASGSQPVPTPEIADAMALVATADVLFTPDTSVAHMASAFSTPALVMFPTAEGAEQWGLYECPGVNLVADSDNLADLPVERVYRELVRLIGSVAEGTPE